MINLHVKGDGVIIPVFLTLYKTVLADWRRDTSDELEEANSYSVRAMW